MCLLINFIESDHLRKEGLNSVHRERWYSPHPMQININEHKMIQKAETKKIDFVSKLRRCCCQPLVLFFESNFCWYVYGCSQGLRRPSWLVCSHFESNLLLSTTGNCTVHPISRSQFEIINMYTSVGSMLYHKNNVSMIWMAVFFRVSLYLFLYFSEYICIGDGYQKKHRQ